MAAREYTPPTGDGRLLAVEVELREHRKRFKLALLGYVILALGTVASFFLGARVLNDNKDRTESAIVGAGIICEVAIAPEEEEAQQMEQLSQGKVSHLSSDVCERLVRQLRKGD